MKLFICFLFKTFVTNSLYLLFWFDLSNCVNQLSDGFQPIFRLFQILHIFHHGPHHRQALNGDPIRHNEAKKIMVYARPLFFYLFCYCPVHYDFCYVGQREPYSFLVIALYVLNLKVLCFDCFSDELQSCFMV